MKHFHGAPKEERALNAFVKLMRAAETVQGRLMSALDCMDLTASQFAVLEALYHVGPLCLSDLAHKILKTSGNLTMVVGNLQKRGLVTRTRSASDKRYYQITITDKGRKLMAQVFPKHLGRLVAMMSALSPSQQETLAALAKKLGTSAANTRTT